MAYHIRHRGLKAKATSWEEGINMIGSKIKLITFLKLLGIGKDIFR